MTIHSALLDIFSHHAPCSDDEPRPDLDSWNHDCASTHQRPLPHRHPAAQRRIRGDMSVIPDDAIMINDGGGIDDDVLAQGDSRLNDRTAHHDGPRSPILARSEGMEDDTEIPQSFDHPFPSRIIPDSDNAILIQVLVPPRMFRVRIINRR